MVYTLVMVKLLQHSRGSCTTIFVFDHYGAQLILLLINQWIKQVRFTTRSGYIERVVHGGDGLAMWVSISMACSLILQIMLMWVINHSHRWSPERKKTSENTESLEIDALVTDPTRALLNLLQILLRMRSSILLL
ncbi:hypothetical protein NC653_019088 [Populus alba x Populus x berolinensis]|uniref:Uncharacterized protein n=1 Tax=Populus alba x Populus x berolinensis TaxID=444605 RepID=A0AAD6VWM8_9ROSI|nr:hypothetical protein NC653_019088 [Populus alba x Populus x berolinensis]